MVSTAGAQPAAAAANLRAARLAAHAILADTKVPSAAAGSSGCPGACEYLGHPPNLPLTPNLVGLHAFYVETGAPAAIVRWFSHNRPAGSSAAGSGTESDGGHTVLWEIDFAWPPVHNVLANQAVTVAVAVIAKNEVGIRLDSQVVYRPRKWSADDVQAGADRVRVLVAVPKPNGDPGQLLEPTLTTTKAFRLSDITAAVNALQVLVPSAYPCPPGPDLQIYVEFTYPGHESPSAIVVAYPYGCAFVAVTHNGRWSGQYLVDGGTLAQHLADSIGLVLPPVPPGVHT
ncbi:MAG TPA: hypothetical protein VGP46_09630 [Acidimicrobiales bacterium]|jgi:hypothetical protein|nr:hypothetical protein [Acidimicrobiales bacterium]